MRNFQTPGLQTGDEFNATQEAPLIVLGDALALSGDMPYGIQYTVSGIDLKAAAATLIFTTANIGKRFRPRKVTVECTAANTFAVACTLSVGQNSATYNDVLAASAITGVLAVNTMLAFNTDLVAIVTVAPNTGVYVKVTVGATATTATGRVTVFGEYI